VVLSNDAELARFLKTRSLVGKKKTTTPHGKNIQEAKKSQAAFRQPIKVP